MSLRQGGSHPFERRQSIRCSVSGPRRHAQLRIGTRQVPARVLDESVGGFAIEVNEDVACQLGDTVLLEIALAWVEVRVISIDKQDAADDDPHFDGDQLPTRLGLMRLRDVDEWEIRAQEQRTRAWSRTRSLLVPLMPRNRSFCGYATMGAAIVAAAVLILWLLEHSVPLVERLRVAAPSGDPAPSLSDHLQSIPERPAVRPRMLDRPAWFPTAKPQKDRPARQTWTSAFSWSIDEEPHSTRAGRGTTPRNGRTGATG